MALLMAEFRNVATRPLDRNGLGLSFVEAHDEITRMEGFFSLLGETEDVYNEWKRLVLHYKVMGVSILCLTAIRSCVRVGTDTRFNRRDP